MSCGVVYGQVLDPALLWLRCRLAAVALIRLLAWEPPYALGTSPKSQKKKKKKKKKSASAFISEKIKIYLSTSKIKPLYITVVVVMVKNKSIMETMIFRLGQTCGIWCHVSDHIDVSLQMLHSQDQGRTYTNTQF